MWKAAFLIYSHICNTLIVFTSYLCVLSLQMSCFYCMSPNFVCRNWDKNTSNIEQHITHFIISFIVPGSESHLQTALTLLIKLQNVTNDGNPGLCSYFPHINATLKKLLLTCNAACTVQVSTDNVSFNNKQHITLGKKMELQPWFSVTVNTPRHKTQKNNLQHSNQVYMFTFLYLANLMQRVKRSLSHLLIQQHEIIAKHYFCKSKRCSPGSYIIV